MAHVLEFHHVKEVDALSLQIHVVHPKYVRYTRVQIREFGAGSKVHVHDLAEYFELVEKLDVTVQLLSHRVVVEGVEVDVEDVVHFVAADRNFSRRKKAHQNRTVPMPVHALVQSVCEVASSSSTSESTALITHDRCVGPRYASDSEIAFPDSSLFYT